MPRITVPKNKAAAIKLAQTILAKHKADGAASPLAAINIADMTDKTAIADTQHQLSEKLYRDAVTATQNCDLALGSDYTTPGRVNYYLASVRDILRVLLYGVICFVAMAAPAYSQSGLLLQHLGNNNPAGEGFASYISTHHIVGPTNNDAGMDAWITAIPAGSATLSYSQSLTAQQQTALSESDWTMSVTLRVVQSSGAFGNIYVDLYTGSQWFQLGFGSEANRDPFVRVGTSSLSPVFVLHGASSSYNNYQLLYNTGTDTADLWVNGIKEISNVHGGQQSYRTAEISWGIAQSGSAPFQANWNQVSLQIIPEPSALALLVGGILLLSARRRRCQNQTRSHRLIAPH